MNKFLLCSVVLSVFSMGKAYSNQYDVGGGVNSCQTPGSNYFPRILNEYCEATWQHFTSHRTDTSAYSTLVQRRNNLTWALGIVLSSIKQYGTDACDYNASALQAIHRRIIKCMNYEDADIDASKRYKLRKISGQAEMLARLGHTPEHIRYDRWLASIDLSLVPDHVADALRAKRWDFRTAKRIYEMYVNICRSMPNFC